MSKLLDRIMDDYDENDTVINARNARITAVFLCVLCVLVSLFFGNVRVFAAGIFLGGAVAQLLFRQHELTIGKSIGAANAQSVTVSNYMVRLIIKGVTVFIAIKNPDVSIIGCILGLLSVPYGIYVLAFADWIIHRKNGKEV